MTAKKRIHVLTWLGLLILPVLLVSPSDVVAQETAGDRYEEAKELYEQGRRRVRRDDYRRAAEVFQEVHEEYGSSEYAADALYWEAFALYKLEQAEGLHRALDLLERQERRFPDAYQDGDGESLATRIHRLLAEAGDLEAAERITRDAARLGEFERQEARTRAREEEHRALEAEHHVREAGHREHEGDQLAREEAMLVAERHHEGDHEGGRSHHREDDIRLTALEALLHMDSDRAVPILQDVLQRRDADSAELRAKAVFVLAQKHTDETAELLIDVARNDPDAEVRNQAIFWMGQVPGEETLDLLAEILASEEDPELQAQAAFAVSQQHSRRASEILRDLAMDETRSPDVRGQAVFWLGQRSGEESYDFLVSLYASLEDRYVKEQVISAISQNAGERELDWLHDLARDAGEPLEVREQAIFWLGQSGHLSIEQLEELYDSMEEPKLREKVIFALSQMHSRDAVDLLIKIAREDPDPELQRHAVFWLGQTGDDRAADVLLEIINGGGDQ